MDRGAVGRSFVEVLAVSSLLLAAPASADTLRGQVLGAGAPIAKSTVTLWGASAGEPKQLAQAQTGADGRFTLSASGAPGKDAVFYVVAKGGQATANKGSGDNPAIALLAVLGNKPPAKVVVNEFTTVASVWTHAQFLDGTAIKGHVLGLRIAAGNVPNFVDLVTGGWGDAIQSPLNSGQTPTMANFATLADVLSGCVTAVSTDACSKLFAASTPPTGGAPSDTLTAAQSIARYPWYQPERVFALLDQFYPVPQGKNMRAVPTFDPLRWAGSDDLLRHGQARPRTPDRTDARAIGKGPLREPTLTGGGPGAPTGDDSTSTIARHDPHRQCTDQNPP